jgi:PhnB protein
MQIQPYLFFDGRCEQAIAFYREAVGARLLMLMRYGEAPGGAAQCPDGSTPPADKVMHAAFQVGQSTVLASDGFSRGQPEFKGFSLSLGTADDAGAKRAFEALAAGGQVQVPLGPTFFASSFGMLVDRFGVQWMINIGAATQG